MLDKHEAKTYPTEYAAKIAAEELNDKRTSAEIERGRYMAIPNHFHGVWLVAPVYY